jgi:hypothetical protein
MSIFVALALPRVVAIRYTSAHLSLLTTVFTAQEATLLLPRRCCLAADH